MSWIGGLDKARLGHPGLDPLETTPLDSLLVSNNNNNVLCCHSLYGHVRRLPGTPAHVALKLSVEARGGSCPCPAWKRPRGRPRSTWVGQLEAALESQAGQLWHSAAVTHGLGGSTSPLMDQENDDDDDDDNDDDDVVV